MKNIFQNSNVLLRSYNFETTKVKFRSINTHFGWGRPFMSNCKDDEIKEIIAYVAICLLIISVHYLVKIMQEILGFAIMVVAVSASGVMSPGPLFSANIIYGLKEGKIAGLKIAVGHTIVEFPLIILLGTGIITSNIFPELYI